MSGPDNLQLMKEMNFAYEHLYTEFKNIGEQTKRVKQMQYNHTEADSGKINNVLCMPCRDRD